MRYVKPIHLFRDLMKNKPSQRGCLLGLDVGEKWVGLAISDANFKIASPLSVLMRQKTNIDLMADDFQNLTSQLNLAGFVFGRAFNSRRKIPDSVQVNVLIDDLCNTGKLEGLNYTFWDEGFTSKSAELMLRGVDFHPVTYKSIIDKFAAVEILQGYLDFVNKRSRMQQSEV